MPKLNPGLAIALFEMNTDARASPVTVGVHELELEVGVGDASGDTRAPIVAGPEPQLVLRALGRLPSRRLRPPLIQPERSAHALKDFLERSSDGKVVKNVSHRYPLEFSDRSA